MVMTAGDVGSLDDSDMAESKVGSDELAGDAGVFRGAEKADQTGYVGERWKTAEGGGSGEGFDLGSREIAAGHGCIEGAGEHRVDQVTVLGEIGGRGENQALECGLRDAVGELGLAGEVLPDGTDDTHACGGSEKVLVKKRFEGDEDINDIGAVDFEVLVEIYGVDG